MKTLVKYIFPALFLVLGAFYAKAENEHTSDSTNTTAQFADSIYNAYIDSIKNSLFPPLKIVTLDTANYSPEEPRRKSPGVVTWQIPTNVDIQTSNSVVCLPIESGELPNGAKNYRIPIDVCPGVNGMKPELSYDYNSFQGNSVYGFGWNLSGISTITRLNKNIYYDGFTDGIHHDISDAFALDDERLLKISETDSQIIYESAQSKVKVIGYFADSTLSYFEAFYPDGTKSRFGFADNSKSQAFYPQTLKTDLFGNEIIFAYNTLGNHYYIDQIDYNGAKVKFLYGGRDDQLISYEAGEKVSESMRLNVIQCYIGDTYLHSYNFIYSCPFNKSVLTHVRKQSSSRNIGTVKFYYGNNNESPSFKQQEAQLLKWYEVDSPGRLRVTKGRFDYSSGLEGLIVYPNNCSYWVHHKGNSLFSHSENFFENCYKPDEEILICTGLNGSWADPIKCLTTEKGFIDILCADIEGKQEEFIIKINNNVVDGLDQVKFTVYRSSTIAGLALYSTLTFNLPTAIKDGSGHWSVQPKHYYPGDFDGDGKMEILAVSAHHVFDDKCPESKCYIFDLEENAIMFMSHVFPFECKFLGADLFDAQIVNNATDRLLILDYDGDGKSDMCHINNDGATVYSFNTSFDGVSILAHDNQLNKNNLPYRDILEGDFNGDGKTDLLVTPHLSTTGYTYKRWEMYFSTGKDSFEKTEFTGPTKKDDVFHGFIVHDIDNDGTSDLIEYDKENFITYMNKRNSVAWEGKSFELPRDSAILIPTDINSHNTSTQLISLKDGKATCMSYNLDANLASRIHGMSNAFGVIEHNDYRYIDASVANGVYSAGTGAQYPYITIQEPLHVLASTTVYHKDEVISKREFFYHNGIVHRHGLGFCGFQKVTEKLDGEFKSESVFDPYRYSVMTHQRTNTSESDFTYTVINHPDRRIDILLKKSEETDLLTNYEKTTEFTYDDYGFPVTETTIYNDGNAIVKGNTFAHEPDNFEGYNLGFQTSQSVIKSNNNASVTDKVIINEYEKRKPLYISVLRNGKRVKSTALMYDSVGNNIRKSVYLCDSYRALDTIFEYDSFSRLIKKTIPGNLSTSFTYNKRGQISDMTDFRGGTTKYFYDDTNRILLTQYPDSTEKRITYAWSNFNDAVYTVSEQETSKPKVVSDYDAFNQQIRTTTTCFNGDLRHRNFKYDTHGNLTAASLPYFSGDQAEIWDEFEFDRYDRPTTTRYASGRLKSIIYDGSTVCEINEGIRVTKQLDALGNVIHVSDGNTEASYTLRPDGQPISIEFADGISTEYSYDALGHVISMTDPSAGTTSFEYDEWGNLAKETDSDGNSVTYLYDNRNRLSSKSHPEFTTTYAYNEFGDLTSVQSTNGTGKTFTYDSFGRQSSVLEKGIDNVWLRKDFTYSAGNVSSIKYTSHKGNLLTESRSYSNGYLKQVKVNDSITIFNLESENELGLPIEVTSDLSTRIYHYDEFGLPTKRMAKIGDVAVQDLTLEFDRATNNLLSRTDNVNNVTETFAYDALNRLVSDHHGSIGYDSNGNITEKSSVGTFSYETPGKPYAVSAAYVTDQANIPTLTQSVQYTSFHRPLSITENNKTAQFTYNADFERVNMKVQSGSKTPLSDRHYLSECYEYVKGILNSTERLYLLGDYYRAPVVFTKTPSMQIVADSSLIVKPKAPLRGDSILITDRTLYDTNLYSIFRDHTGSIMAIAKRDGTIAQSLSYDAWGRLRDPKTLELLDATSTPSLLFGRGYSGHEHLPWFGLINMNARLYDPVVGRFLSPDPYIQAPDMLQNFNRYSYALNNPLKYTDPSGKFFLFTLFNLYTDFWGNLFNHGVKFRKYNWTRTVNSWKINMGMFQGNVGQVINKWTWGIVNSSIGNQISEIYNTLRGVDKVTRLDGMLALSGATKGNSAMTIGHYSLGPDNYVADWRDHLFVHEYGHYIQTQIMGITYFKHVAIPSLLSAAFIKKWSGVSHINRWFEADASQKGMKHFTGRKDVDGNAFDPQKFQDGNNTDYINPRLNSKEQDGDGYPLKGTFTIWDLIIL